MNKRKKNVIKALANLSAFSFDDVVEFKVMLLGLVGSGSFDDAMRDALRENRRGRISADDSEAAVDAKSGPPGCN